MKFIIKVGDWCEYFVEGDIKELQNKFAQFGCTFTGKKSCNEENLGVHFSEVITTELKCRGFDKKLCDSTFQSITDVLIDKLGNDGLVVKALENNWGFTTYIRSLCDNRDIVTDLISVFCSDGENYDVPDTIIIPRDYDSINAIEEDDFWNCLHWHHIYKPNNY